MLSKLLKIIKSIEKVLWGIMAFFPWMLLLSLLVLEYAYGGIPALNNQTHNELIVTMVIVIVSLFISVAFILHALTNQNFSKKVKIEWAFLLFITNMFVYPSYWWLHIKGDQTVQLYESSSSFDEEMIKPFLIRLSHAIDSGIDSSKVNELRLFTTNVEPEEQNETSFYIKHGGHKERVIFRVFADDIDTYAIYIYASKNIVKLINTETDLLFNEFYA